MEDLILEPEISEEVLVMQLQLSRSCEWCADECEDVCRDPALDTEPLCDKCYEDSFICSWCNERSHNTECHCIGDEEICDECYGRSFECNWCDNRFPEDEAILASGGNESICEPCWEKWGQQCDWCGSNESEDEIHSAIDRGGRDCEICIDCLENATTTCDDCGEMVHVDYSAWDDSISLCVGCIEDDWVRCCDCDQFIRINDAFYAQHAFSSSSYCDGCWDANREDCHSQRPPFVFHGKPPQFLGVELEIDRPEGSYDEHHDALDKVNDIMGDFVWTCEDGSLRNGFEIVSLPASMDVHYRKPWEGLLKAMVREGYRSHNVSTCGIHVHVSRKSFGESVEQQERGISIILYLMEKFWNEWKRFSRRSEARLNEWARRYLSSDEPMEEDLILNKAKQYIKYSCVSLCRPDTLEFRIFRGSLRYKTFMAAVELVDSLVSLAVRSSINDVYDISWEELKLELSNGYQYLEEYFEYRNL